MKTKLAGMGVAVGTGVGVAVGAGVTVALGSGVAVGAESVSGFGSAVSFIVGELMVAPQACNRKTKTMRVDRTQKHPPMYSIFGYFRLFKNESSMTQLKLS